MLDTGFLITMTDADRPHHDVALQYMSALVEHKHRILVSPLAVSEYAVKSNPQGLFAMGCFEFPEYNLMHALKAAEFKQFTLKRALRSGDNTRAVVVNDTQIMAQAAVENVQYVLTEDVNIFCKNLQVLREMSLIDCKAISLTEGYQSGLFEPTCQAEFDFEQPQEQVKS